MPFTELPPLYQVWQSMKQRCLNPNSPSFHRYGGRGITICDRWLNSYHNFASDMGHRPDGYEIDRIDNNGPYSPENCRWVTCKQNMRNTGNIRKIVVDNKEYLACEISDQTGLKRDTIIERAKKGLSLEEITNPEKRTNLSGLALGGRVSGDIRKAAPFCKNGHARTEENIMTTPQGWRRCKVCHRERERDRRKARDISGSPGQTD